MRIKNFFINLRYKLSHEKKASFRSEFEVNSEFVSSVGSFSSLSIDENTLKKAKERKTLPTIIKSVAALLLFAVFCGSVLTLVNRSLASRAIQKENEEIDPLRITSALIKPRQLGEGAMLTLYELLQTGGLTGTEHEYETDAERRSKIHDQVVSLSNQYADLYGWVYCREFNISYPIMHRENDGYTYYLTHSYKGTESSNGAIFAAETNIKNHEDNLNLVLTGHNMTDGTMFRGIKLWMDRIYSAKVASASKMQLEVYTRDAVYIYEFFSAYIDADWNHYNKTSFDSLEQYEEYLDLIKSRSDIWRPTSYDQFTRICTLVTCTNVKSEPDNRFVIHLYQKAKITDFYY